MTTTSASSGSHGIFEYGRVLLADVPGIDEPAAGTVLGELHQQHGRAQHVPGVFERHA
ncbi:MAG: hypothetical protein ACOX5J_11230 [Candidatus Hydrogenedentales bacterium]